MIARELAIQIARDRAEANGWAFSEPLAIVQRRPWLGWGRSRFEIETNAGNRGTKARFVIDGITGEVLREGYIPAEEPLTPLRLSRLHVPECRWPIQPSA